MTATQHSTFVETLPQAIRRLEAAGPGDLALAPGGSPCAMKMEHDSGRPWLLDPWGHVGAPTRVTTSMVAQMGYRTDVDAPPRKDEAEPTPEAALVHLNTLVAQGWPLPAIAAAAGLSAVGIRRTHRRQAKVHPSSAEKILSIDPDSAPEGRRPSRTERLEDAEFLLDNNVAPEQVAIRCGYSGREGLRKAAQEAGWTGLHGRLLLEPEPVEQDLDDYDPYDDPEFA